MNIRFLFLTFVVTLLLAAGLYAATVAQARPADDYALATDDGLELHFSSDGRLTGLQIDGREWLSAAGPALFVRDLSAAGQVTEPNLLTNPGFEMGLAGWTEAINQGLAVSLTTSPTHERERALQFTNDLEQARFAAYSSDLMAVRAGQRYRASAWWRSERGYVLHPAGTPVDWQINYWREAPRGNALYVQWLDETQKIMGDPELVTPLHWNSDRWRLTRGEIRAPAGAAFARLIFGVQLTDNTLWVDDLSFVPATEPELPLTGSIQPCPDSRAQTNDCLVQSIPLPEAGLRFTLTYRARPDHIRVEGEVEDVWGQDRALDITWAAAIAAENGIWWDDVHNSRAITEEVEYANAISAIYDGQLPMSLYPYAGLQVGEQGLALALPLDRPQTALLAYDAADQRYRALFHAGISPQAARVGSRARFDLMLYRFDPAWGFRDVIARHRHIQPAAYATDLPIYDYDDRSQGQYYTPAGAQVVKAEDATNTYSAQYIVGEVHLRTISDTEPMPDMDLIMTLVTDTLASPNPRTRAQARALVNSASLDANREWSIKKVGSFPWSNNKWEIIWAANVDPDMADGLASFMTDWTVDPAFEATEAIDARLDGVQIDNFMSNPTVDLRPEALAATDSSLIYSPHTYQPGVHTGFAFYEYLAFLRRHLDETWGADRGITVNFWGVGHPNYLAPFIDGFGSEGKLRGGAEGENWTPKILDYRRAIAFSKPYMFANQTPGLTAAEAYTFSQMALLYGVWPGHGPNGEGWQPEAEQIISDTATLLKQYWAAGWEPLTYARADEENVWIERFGRVSEGGESLQKGLYFTIHNRDDLTRTTNITLEAQALGLLDPESAQITDIAISETIPFSVENHLIHFDLTLGPKQ
ncbi:MAG: hypothetical protein GXP42_02675, partial [Chloroflexi bacterium]|nr:hypothetical protein [Chloroflexota bacterium]